MKLILNSVNNDDFYLQEHVVKSVMRDDIKDLKRKNVNSITNKMENELNKVLNEGEILNTAYNLYVQKKPKNANEAERISREVVISTINKIIKNSIFSKFL